MKAILIDAAAREIREVEYAGLADLQKLVGGYIEAAYQWSNGDVLFVDEEGLLKKPTTGFVITRRPDQGLAGNGVIVGPEIGDSADTEPPTMTVAALRHIVRFLP